MVLFHPRHKRVLKILEAECQEQGGPGQVGPESSQDISVYDSVQRHLLGGGLVLLSTGSRAELRDAMGDIRWNGDLAGIRGENGQDMDPALRILIGLRLDEWRLGKVASVQCTHSSWHISLANNPQRESSVNLTVLLTVARHGSSDDTTTEGVFVELQCAEGGETSAKSIQKALLETGGISCPWPFMLLAQRGAAANGWIDPERIWTDSQKWSDLLRPLVHLLKGIRDNGDPACIQEARTQIKHLRLLIDLSRQLQGKNAKAHNQHALKDLHEDLGRLRAYDLLLQLLGDKPPAGQWTGIPRVLDDYPGWSLDDSHLLRSEIERQRALEHQRLVQDQRYIGEPEIIIELGSAWPRFPRIERTDALAQGRWQDSLDSRLKKLGREIGRLESAGDPAELWADIRRRCRKVNRMLEVCPLWADQAEIQFLRRQTSLWYSRLGEYEAMQTNQATLLSIAEASNDTRLRNVATALAHAIAAWLGLVNPQLAMTIPTLALSAHNARRRLA